MQRFFDRPDTHWRSLTECLHIYAVPARDAEVRADFEAMAAGLATEPGLGHQPVEHIHMTVQRLDAFRFDVTDAVIEGLADRLSAAAATVEPFDLAFESPVVTSHAIQAIAAPTLEWRMLTVAVRAAVEEAGLAASLTDPPPAPHYTLAYAMADRPDAELRPVLDRIGRPSATAVGSISLVSVDQDPQEGSFRFQVLQEVPLGR